MRNRSMRGGTELTRGIQLTDWSPAGEQGKLVFVVSTTPSLAQFIIHQIFSLARDWSIRVTWANIPQLKLGNIRGYSPIFKTDG